MAYLRLSNPTTDSCDFKVKLSNPFNTDYYKRLRITKTDYGDSTSSVGSYLESRTARNSSSKYVTGVVNSGLSAGSTYKLYAYAQAANSTWYLAGSDYITMKGDESKEIDLGIRDIYYKYKDSNDDYELAENGTVFETGREIKFKVEVKNYTAVRKPDYTVSVYDEDGNRLARDTGETPAEEGEINYAYLRDVIINSSGKQTFEFAIILEDSRWIDFYESDNTKYRDFEWKNKGIVVEQSSYNMDRNQAFPVDPRYINYEGQRSADALNIIIDQFDVENRNRYQRTSTSTFCNIFAWDVTSAMQAELPHWIRRDNNMLYQYDFKKSYSQNAETARKLNVNNTVDWLKNNADDIGYSECTAKEAQHAANRGEVAVTLWKNPNSTKSGHIQVVRPTPNGEEYNSSKGVYLAQAGSNNYNAIYLRDKYSSSYQNALIYYTHK